MKKIFAVILPFLFYSQLIQASDTSTSNKKCINVNNTFGKKYRNETYNLPDNDTHSKVPLIRFYSSYWDLEICEGETILFRPRIKCFETKGAFSMTIKSKVTEVSEDGGDKGKGRHHVETIIPRKYWDTFVHDGNRCDDSRIGNTYPSYSGNDEGYIEGMFYSNKYNEVRYTLNEHRENYTTIQLFGHIAKLSGCFGSTCVGDKYNDKCTIIGLQPLGALVISCKRKEPHLYGKHKEKVYWQSGVSYEKRYVWEEKRPLRWERTWFNHEAVIGVTDI